jgi:hypothetical protein
VTNIRGWLAASVAAAVLTQVFAGALPGRQGVEGAAASPGTAHRQYVRTRTTCNPSVSASCRELKYTTE